MQTRVTRSNSRTSTTTPSPSRARRRSSTLGSSAHGNFDQAEDIQDEDKDISKIQQPKASGRNGTRAHPKRRKTARQSAAYPPKGHLGEETRPPVSLGFDILFMVLEHLCLPDADHAVVSKDIFISFADSIFSGPFYPQPSMCPTGPSAMSRVSLVAKPWREAAQARLFRDPEISNVAELQQVIVATKDSRLGDLVRTVTYAGPVKNPRTQLVCDAPQSSLSALISNCPKLQKVYLDFSLCSCLPNGPSFPAITTLRLRNDSRSSGQNTLDIIYLLSRLPSLQTLVLPDDMDDFSYETLQFPTA